MVTLIFGQTLVFWSGIAAGTIFALLMLTCSVNLRCAGEICSDEKRKKLHGLHKHFVWLSAAAIAAHLFLAILSSLFHVWI